MELSFTATATSTEVVWKIQNSKYSKFKFQNIQNSKFIPQQPLGLGFQSLYPGLRPLGRCRIGRLPWREPGGTGPGATPTRGLLRCPGALDVVVVVFVVVVVVVIVIVVIAIIVIVIMIIMSIMVVILIIITIAIIIIIMIITTVITIIMIRIIVIIVMIITRPGRCLKRQVSGSTVSFF